VTVKVRNTEIHTFTNEIPHIQNGTLEGDDASEANFNGFERAGGEDNPLNEGMVKGYAMIVCVYACVYMCMLF
jgi:hypothetical protein